MDFAEKQDFTRKEIDRLAHPNRPLLVRAVECTVDDLSSDDGAEPHDSPASQGPAPGIIQPTIGALLSSLETEHKVNRLQAQDNKILRDENQHLHRQKQILKDLNQKLVVEVKQLRRDTDNQNYYYLELSSNNQHLHDRLQEHEATIHKFKIERMHLIAHIDELQQDAADAKAKHEAPMSARDQPLQMAIAEPSLSFYGDLVDTATNLVQYMSADELQIMLVVDRAVKKRHQGSDVLTAHTPHPEPQPTATPSPTKPSVPMPSPLRQRARSPLLAATASGTRDLVENALEGPHDGSNDGEKKKTHRTMTSRFRRRPSKFSLPTLPMLEQSPGKTRAVKDDSRSG